ncbi:MAG: type II toxin-antitoxin system VapC family toxin [Xanthobacteraceae bacterium]
MIFVDTSAIVAMIAGEPDGLILADKLQQAGDNITAGHVILESAMRLSSLFDFSPTTADSLIVDLPRKTSTGVVPITEETAHAAVAAFERYGKGRKSRAGLNFGDCLSYACAKVHGARLLFKGGDFIHTDIARA